MAKLSELRCHAVLPGLQMSTASMHADAGVRVQGTNEAVGIDVEFGVGTGPVQEALEVECTRAHAELHGM